MRRTDILASTTSLPARVAKLADARDLKSVPAKSLAACFLAFAISYGFSACPIFPVFPRLFRTFSHDFSHDFHLGKFNLLIQPSRIAGVVWTIGVDETSSSACPALQFVPFSGLVHRG